MSMAPLLLSTLVLLLGRKLVQSVAILKRYTLPEHVAGGLLVALILLLLKTTLDWG